ncbi:hypothetical protein H9P43_001264 [Blastocladiella emersonii ATCC 22665]|nr:hypothetical protein H9P43_001264 [Blastocladiella emersonii ATCC 22665]
MDWSTIPMALSTTSAGANVGSWLYRVANQPEFEGAVLSYIGPGDVTLLGERYHLDGRVDLTSRGSSLAQQQQHPPPQAAHYRATAGTAPDAPSLAKVQQRPSASSEEPWSTVRVRPSSSRVVAASPDPAPPRRVAPSAPASAASFIPVRLSNLPIRASVEQFKSLITPSHIPQPLPRRRPPRQDQAPPQRQESFVMVDDAQQGSVSASPADASYLLVQAGGTPLAVAGKRGSDLSSSPINIQSPPRAILSGRTNDAARVRRSSTTDFEDVQAPHLSESYDSVSWRADADVDDGVPAAMADSLTESQVLIEHHTRPLPAHDDGHSSSSPSAASAPITLTRERDHDAEIITAVHHHGSPGDPTAVPAGARRRTESMLTLDSESSGFEDDIAASLASTMTFSDIANQHPSGDDLAQPWPKRVVHHNLDSGSSAAAAGRARRASLGSPRAQLEADAFLARWQSLPWFTYRTNIDYASARTDTGWGCMHRTGQMLLARAFLTAALGRGHDVRSLAAGGPAAADAYSHIMGMFEDTEAAPFSLPSICTHGADRFGTRVGAWYSPSIIAHVLAGLNEDRLAGTAAARKAREVGPDLVVHVAMDAQVALDPLILRAEGGSDADGDGWRPTLLLVPVMLGQASVHPSYAKNLVDLFGWPQCVGISGGRKDASLYFAGTWTRPEWIRRPSQQQQQQQHFGESPPHESPAASPIVVPWSHVVAGAPGPGGRGGSGGGLTNHHPSRTSPPIPEADKPGVALMARTAMLYLDPHFPQPVPTRRAAVPNPAHHTHQVRALPMSRLDPSMLLGFLLVSRADLDDLVDRVAQWGGTGSPGALFSVIEECAWPASGPGSDADSRAGSARAAAHGGVGASPAKRHREWNTAAGDGGCQSIHSLDSDSGSGSDDDDSLGSDDEDGGFKFGLPESVELVPPAQRGHGARSTRRNGSPLPSWAASTATAAAAGAAGDEFDPMTASTDTTGSYVCS